MKIIASLVLAALLGACQAGAAPAATESAPVPGSVSEGDIRLACGGGPTFPIAALDGPVGAETVDDPAAEALRAVIRDPGSREVMPQAAYRLLIRTDAEALYVAEAPKLDSGLAVVHLVRSDEGWGPVGWGDCRPEVRFERLNGANWELDGEVGADDRTFTALVTERECSGGETAQGRVLPPVVLYRPRDVVVVFAVRPLELPPGVAVGCPSNPSTAVRVELSEPLGGRRLLDGGTWPPVEPTDPSERF